MKRRLNCWIVAMHLWWLSRGRGYSIVTRSRSFHGKIPHFLYSEHNNFTREQADAAFLEAMEVDGISTWRRNGMYQAVRLFGASHFVTDALP